MSATFSNAFTGKRVFVTGHTGFKGAWLSLWLTELGAKVYGYALKPEGKPNLYDQLGLSKLVGSTLGDVLDAVKLRRAVAEARPEFVFHLAAQPLVRRSYREPAETFAVNVQGTANLLEAVRKTPSVRVCQVITSDKCYENLEREAPYRETDALGGRDPYSASKACAELVVASYRRSFFQDGVSLASVRAGNVIGGGDWAEDRIVPDCVRSLMRGKPIVVRNPASVRPWQHVLDPLSGYLTLAAAQAAAPRRNAEAWNFGPSAEASLTVGQLADRVVAAWGSGKWINAGADGQPHEAGLLKLDCAKARQRLGWRPLFDADEAIARMVAWYRAASRRGFDALAFTREQIGAYAAEGVR